MKEWLADTAIGKFLNQTLPQGITNFITPAGPPIASYTDPNAAPPVPLNPLDIITGGGPGSATTPGGLLLPSLTGPPPPVAGAPAPPTPGDRTPILTDTQQAAADEAAGGSAGSLPTAPVLPMQYRSTAGLDSSVAGAMNRQDEVNHAIAEKEARLNQLRSSNVATAEDIQKAENDLVKAENDRLKADQALVDAQTKAADQQTKSLKTASGALEEFGVALDSDFGISKGLAGIAENLIKFVGQLALAGPMAQLGQISAANPNQGSGLMGILGSQGAFGSQYTPAAIAAASGGSGYGPGGTYGTPGAMPLGAGGTPTKDQVKAIAASFGLDVTSENRNEPGSYHNSGSALDIGIPGMSSNDPRKLAFAQYMSENFGSSMEELIYNSPGFSGNVNDGKPHQYSAGTLADHNDHVHVADSSWGAAGDGMGDNYDRQGAGGGNALTQSLYQDATGRWRSSLPGWDHLIQRESSGINQRQGITDVNSGGNVAEGLFQITPQTWAANGGRQYAPSALSASPYDQAQVASNIFGRNPSGRDWGMGLPGRENPNQLMSEIQGAGPSSGLGPGISHPANPGGGASVGGMAMEGLMGAAGAADLMMPGAGALARMGIQLAKRTIEYGAENVGIGVSRIMETLSLGDNPAGSLGNSWLGKVAGGLAGAAPALPNLAGKPPPGETPAAGGAQGAAKGGTPGNVNNTVNVTNNGASDYQNGRAAIRELGAMHAQPGRQ